MSSAEQETALPIDRVGGTERVQAIVETFYDLMDREPDYAALRAMHADDLAPMRRSLGQFLTAWLGGPRTWFEERPGACIMSAHRSLGVSRETAAQWVHAMSRAMAMNGIDPALGSQLQQAFSRMASAMISVPADNDAD